MQQGGRLAATVVALILAGTTACHAQDGAQTRWSLGAGLASRTLQETAGGRTLLTERGPVLQLQLAGVRPLQGGGALGLRLSATGGALDYDGRTSLSLTPYASITRQAEGAADLLWRPAAPSAWGEAWLSAGLLANRRMIAGNATVAGLDETAWAVLLGGLWCSPAWQPVPGWRARVEAEGRVSAWHRVDVGFSGLFDPASFTGAQRRQLALRLHMAPTDSPWTWTLEFSRIAQGESSRLPVTRAAAPTGYVVYQPALWTRDVALRLVRSF